MINFLDITYLKSGTERQQKAYQVLITHEVMEKLSAYTPILVGTIPIKIDIKTSDLDIICYVQNRHQFISLLKESFQKEQDFKISENTNFKSIKSNFMVDDFQFEIFGQNIPTIEQSAYLHMIIEHEILLEKGEIFRKKIISLKKQGYKTEPAFAEILGLEGDPYQSLLEYRSDIN